MPVIAKLTKQQKKDIEAVVKRQLKREGLSEKAIMTRVQATALREGLYGSTSTTASVGAVALLLEAIFF